MDISTVLELVKAGLGISTTVRDAYLLAIIEGVIKELEDEKGITLDESNANHLMFAVDYSKWRYQSHNESGAMPRHLQFRLHNIMVHNGGGSIV